MRQDDTIGDARDESRQNEKKDEINKMRRGETEKRK